MKRIILIIAITLPVSAYGVEWFTPLDNHDIYWQTIYTAITCVDWAQTKSSMARGKRKETNPILGTKPSQHKIDTLIGAAIISHGLVTWVLPGEYRQYWQWVFISIESVVVMRNYKVGVRINQYF